jgi:hypothetical protein
LCDMSNSGPASVVTGLTTALSFSEAVTTVIR